jgi:hypothetical protein
MGIIDGIDMFIPLMSCSDEAGGSGGYAGAEGCCATADSAESDKASAKSA